MKKKKYDTWFEEISLGLRRIRKSSGVSVITIPTKTMIDKNLSDNDEVHVILLIRRRKLTGELNENEVWLQLDKSEAIQFQQFQKQQEELRSVGELL
jgi:hypothetical protein